MFRTILFIAVIGIFVVGIQAQTTEFSYQGSLKDNAAAANGNYDFEFALYDASSAGSQIGATVPRNNVPVANGIFSVKLDFGPEFPGADRFLEIRVRLAGQPGITTLAPRQLVNSAPYSVKSLNTDTATNATQLGGVAANQYVVTTDPRMTDARPPTSGSSDYIQNQNAATQASSNFSISGNGTAGGTFSGNIVNAATRFDLAGNRVLGVSGLSSPNTNTFAGIDSGTSLTPDNTVNGHFNSFFGNQTGNLTTTGFANTFVGASAGAGNTTGEHSTYVGNSAGSTATGSFNAAFGSSAGPFLTTGVSNSFFGTSAGFNTQDGSFNSFMGRGAGQGNTSGSNNAFFGRQAGVGNATGSNNTAIGTSTNVGSSLSFATALGSGASATTSNSVVIGRPADAVQIPGGLSVAGSLATGGSLTGNIVNTITEYQLNGSRVLASPGSNNIFVGPSAGLSGGNNSMFGAGAGPVSTGNNNSFFGFAAGDDNVSGSGNSFFGVGAGAGNVSGLSNVFLGNAAGDTNIDGDDNTAVGTNADVGAANLVNATAIGADALVTQSNSIVLGSINGVNGATANTRVGIGVTAPERPLHVRGAASQEIMIESADVGGNKWTLQSGGAGQNGRFEIIDRTANLSKMTILPTGEVGIGTTGPTSLLTVGSPEATTVAGRVGIFNSTGFNLVLRDTANDVEGFMGLNSGNGVFVGSSSNHQLQFRTNNTSRMTISTAGLVTISNLVAAAATTALCHNASNQIGACTASSLRFKTNVAPFSPGLAFVNRLRPISYDWKDGGAKDVGFGAEDIAKIDPRFVTFNAAGEVEGVKYDRLSVAFVNAFKEQQEQIENQKAEIESLKIIVCELKPSAAICKK